MKLPKRVSSAQSSDGFKAAASWYAVGILMLLYCLSFTDRLILSLLAAPISLSLHVSDTQIGLLYGLGFGLLYALVGLPIAHFIDQKNRVRIITAGVLVWGVSTISSGFAANFTQLMVARSGVAVGEAVLSPAAISIIADLFPAEKRTLPTSVYNLVSTFMGAGAFIFGGAALELAHRFTALSGLEPWRLTLIIVGLPAFLMAPLFILTVREPKRQEETSGDFASAKEAWDYVKGERQLYAGLFIGMSFYATAVFGFQAWTPTLLIRGYGIAASRVGLLFGVVGASAGVLGAVTIPLIVTAASRKGAKSILIVLLSVGMGLAIASVFVTGATRSPGVVFVTVAGLYFFGATGGLVPPLIVQAVTPGRMRARVIAGNYLAANLIGLGVGPALTAFLGDKVFHGSFALADSLMAVAAVCCRGAMLSTWVTRGRFQVALDLANRRRKAVQFEPRFENAAE